jgi:hypothetical protein
LRKPARRLIVAVSHRINETRTKTAVNKTVSLAFLTGGIVLLTYGYHAAQSTSSAFSRIFTGSPNNKTIWMMVTGTICVVVGIAGLSRSK